MLLLSNSSAFIFLLSFVSLYLSVEGFLVERPLRAWSSSKSPTSLKIMWDPKRNADQINSELVDFPTPSQKMQVRKEASKRQARKKLTYFSLPAEDTHGNFADETLEEIWKLLNENEIVQIRGISRDAKKMTFSVATRLCLELEWHVEKYADLDCDSVLLPVALLSIKGHSVIIYSPTLDLDDPKKIPLRTSVGQKNTWTARIKAPRDNRGQIIQEKRE